jgi:hypothetical protein
MSALGHKRTFRSAICMSAFPPNSGHEMAICDLWDLDVRFGAKNVRFTPESGHSPFARRKIVPPPRSEKFIRGALGSLFIPSSAISPRAR